MASTSLYRTPSSTGNRQKFTLSVWCKKHSSSQMSFLGAGASNQQNHIQFADDRFQIRYYTNTNNTIVNTKRLLRDPSAWYHLVCSVDTTQSTASNRVKLYVNGELAELNDTTYPGQNGTWDFNLSGTTMYVGRRGHSNAYIYDGVMSHLHWIDGTAYDASPFGSTDSTTGQWKINVEPSVTYGTNGFFLFKDNAALTDQSGNGNNFTLSAGTLTKTEDTPDNVFNTLNRVAANQFTLSNGDTTATVSGQSFVRTFITNTIAPESGKWYWESKLITSGGSDRTSLGICSTEENVGDGQVIPQNELSIATGYSRIRFTENGSTTEVDSFYTVPSANDIFMYALDLDNNKFYFGVNGNWWNYNSSQTGGDPTSGSGYVTNSTNIIKGAMSAFIRVQAGAAATTFTNSFNFGNGFFGTTAVSSAGTNASGFGIFEYNVPTGYTALCTKGLNL